MGGKNIVKYSEKQILKLYQNQLVESNNLLKKLKIFCGTKEPLIQGLHGWIFEQVIQYCLREELDEIGLTNLQIREQVTFHGRKKADLKISNIIIEIKSEGLFGKKSIQKYKEYKKIADKMGLQYLYITGGERVKDYIKGTINSFGNKNTFFLDEEGHWEKFVNRIIDILKNR